MSEGTVYREIPAGDGTFITPLPIGTRIRHKRHLELTGAIKGYEWNRPGVLSAIPYCIAWDDDDRACEVLGWFFVYASDVAVERITGDSA